MAREGGISSMNLIAAVDKNWGIGLKNKLLVSIPDDMKFFRQTTTGKVVVMGRKTLESFPGRKPLKNRVNIVLTRDRSPPGCNLLKAVPAESMGHVSGTRPVQMD